MTRSSLTQSLSLRQAYKAEIDRREGDRLDREAKERAQQEADHAAASALYAALEGDPGFLGEHGLHLDRTRYAVILEHTDFRLRAYFEAGEASVTSADRRTATTPTAVPRKQAMAASVEEALILLAQFLADETLKC